MLRVDRDAYYAPDKQDVAAIAQYIRVQPLDAVVLSDYDHGWLSTSMAVEAIRAAKLRKIPTIVDPKKALIRYWGCDLICPTENEIDGGYSHYANVLLKRGALGMRLVEGLNETDIPAVARHVYDVTGAGDTVVAVVAAAVAAGASYLEAARLAAVAAGYVVGEVGTTVCPLEKLKELVNDGR